MVLCRQGSPVVPFRFVKSNSFREDNLQKIATRGYGIRLIPQGLALGRIGNEVSLRRKPDAPLGLPRVRYKLMATRILIADDHEVIRKVLRTLINSHDGWQVCAEAKNGSEAVVQARELRPDLIVLDLAMPVMDGMKAAREITKSSPDARVIMFTLHASPEVEEQAKRVGVRQVISKARDGGRLVSAMEQALGEGDHSTEPSAAAD